MRRDVTWTTRNEAGDKQEICFRFEGGDRIRWQMTSFSTGVVDNAYHPTAEDWDLLLKKIEDRYRRRQCPFKDLQLVQRLAAAQE